MIETCASVGTWFGFLGQKIEHIWPFGPMLTFDLHVSEHGTGFEAVGSMPDSMRGIAINVSGHVETTPRGATAYVLRIRLSVNAIVLELRGQLNEDGKMLSGDWSREQMGTGPYDIGPFVMTQLPPEILSARPSPWEFEENRVRALWRFALAAVKYQVLRSRYSWRFFEQRRDARRRVVESRKKGRYGQALSKEEKREDIEMDRRLSYADARFYVSLAEYEELQGSCVHVYVTRCFMFIAV